MLNRRKLITLAAPALIIGRDVSAQPVPTVLSGFPSGFNPRAYPILNPAGARRWNAQNPLSGGLQFGIAFGQIGLLRGWDFVNNINWYQQNSGTQSAPIPGVSRGSLLRFTSSTPGYIIPSITTPSARILSAYYNNMLGAISLIVVCCWPIGATSTGARQTAISVGDNNLSGYNVPFDFAVANTMDLYRAGSGGAAYYTSSDSGAGAGTEYNQPRITTLGVSHSGAFPGGASAVRFYRRGVWTGSSTVGHDMSTNATVGVTNTWVGQTGNNSGGAYGYFNGFLSMIYGWNRALSDVEFLAVENDPFWALRVPAQPILAGVGSATAAITGRPRGVILP